MSEMSWEIWHEAFSREATAERESLRAQLADARSSAAVLKKAFDEVSEGSLKLQGELADLRRRLAEADEGWTLDLRRAERAEAKAARREKALRHIQHCYLGCAQCSVSIDATDAALSDSPDKEGTLLTQDEIDQSCNCGVNKGGEARRPKSEHLMSCLVRRAPDIAKEKEG